MNRLNFGCGSIRPDGWVNVDLEPGEAVDDPIRRLMEVRAGYYGYDIRDGLALPWENAFDYAVAHCSIQELTHHELGPALAELHRVLKPGGTLRVSVPDMRRAIQALVSYEPNWFPQGDDLTDLDERYCTYVTWFGTSRSIFTEQYLRLLLERAGFSVARLPFGRTACMDEGITELDAREGECIFMEGRRA